MDFSPAYVPGPHVRQVELPSSPAYLPVSHLMHSYATEPLYVPASQLRQPALFTTGA
jgi:hypothetical protein